MSLPTPAVVLVRLLGSLGSLVALMAILASVWLPYVYHSNTSVHFGSGVVQESTNSDVEVVLLDSGEYTTLDEDTSLPAGERVEVYDTDWSSPTSSASTSTLWALTILVGVLGLAVTAFILAYVGGAAVDALESRLARRST